jgi:CBS domain-containing protein
MPDPRHVPTARDIMTHALVSFRPETNIFEAIKKLVDRRISGAPVVDENGQMVGMLSELDCLNVLASDEFYDDDHSGSEVSDYMSTAYATAAPEVDIYWLAQHFLRTPVRRFPVVERGHLLGQVSLSDVLRGIEEMRKKRTPRKHYPDYRAPA